MRKLPSWMTVLAIAAAAVLGLVAGGDSRAQESRPANDDFADYKYVTLPEAPSGSPNGEYNDSISTVGATREQGEPDFVAGGTVWYLFYAGISAEFVIDTAGSDFPTDIGIYHLSGLVPSPPGGGLVPVAAAENPAGPSSMTFATHAYAGHYAIQLGGYRGATGELRVRIACARACVPPNDDIDRAARVETAHFKDLVANDASTLEPGEPQPCGSIGSTAWYRLETLQDAGDRIRVYATLDDRQPVVALYKQNLGGAPSPPGSLTLLACDAGTAATMSGILEFTTEPFTTYFVQSGGANGDRGLLATQISCVESTCAFSAADDPAERTPTLAADNESVENDGIAPPDTGSGGYLPGAREHR